MGIRREGEKSVDQLTSSYGGNEGRWQDGSWRWGGFGKARKRKRKRKRMGCCGARWESDPANSLLFRRADDDDVFCDGCLQVTFPRILISLTKIGDGEKAANVRVRRKRSRGKSAEDLDKRGKPNS